MVCPVGVDIFTAVGGGLQLRKSVHMTARAVNEYSKFEFEKKIDLRM